MPLEVIKEGLPKDLENQLLEKEKVHYFSYISYQGGCLSSSSKDEYWIGLTSKRVIYKAKIKENNIITEKDGILPLDKISFIQVTEATESSGCSSTKAYYLEISTSGGTVGIPLPTKEKCYEIRNIYSEISHGVKRKKHE